MISNILMVVMMLAVLSFAATLARSIDTSADQHTPTHQSQQDSILLAQLQLVNAQQADRASRIKRQAYGSSDYYNNYYNDYYSNYYANQNNVRRPSQAAPSAPAPIRQTAERFDDNQIDNGFDSFDRGDQVGSNGPKYVYTPLFQYKSTHGKHQKLFVPNIFG